MDDLKEGLACKKHELDGRKNRLDGEEAILRKLNDDVAMMTEVIAQEQAGRKELEVKVMQAQMDEVQIPDNESPQGAILRIQYYYAKLISLQKQRGKQPPDESDVCLDVVHRLPAGMCYDEIKHYEASNPNAAELTSLFSLRIYCQQRFDVWVQNAGHLRQGKRTLAAVQSDDDDEDDGQGDCYDEQGQLCYAGAYDRYIGKGYGKG